MQNAGRTVARLVLMLAAAIVAVCPLSSRALASGPPYLVAADFPVGTSRLTDLVVDGAGNAIVSGVVSTYGFSGIDTAKYTNGARGRRFIAKFPPLSTSPSFVAVVGLPNADLRLALSDNFTEDEATGLALDANGNAYLVAHESVDDYPVTGGPFRESTGNRYIYKVSSTGSVSRYSIGLDPAIKRVGAIALDATGAIYLTGSAKEGLQTSAGAPWPTASTAAGCVAPYVTKFHPSGQSVLYATYLGASGTAGQICGGNIPGQKIYSLNIHPTGFALAIDSAGNAYVTGQVEPGLPATSGALDLGTKALGPFSGNNLIQDPALHAFVTKLDPAGNIVYTARIGGSFRDRATSIMVDGNGSAVIAGKTSSPDFPQVGGAIGNFPFVTMECLLWTPEVGFLARLSADGRQLNFSGYVALDGDQLDDCSGGSASFNPARLATDSSGNIYVAGSTTPSNRYFQASAGSIIPDQSHWGGQLLQIFSADGSRKIYASALPSNGVTGIAVDPWQNIVVATRYSLQRIASGSMPVQIQASPSIGCANQPLVLTASIAASNDNGAIDFAVDGVGLGSASIANGIASKTVTISTVGVRKLSATYHGAGPFDGYASPDLHFAFNQAGTCQ